MLVGFFQSWNMALSIFNLCLISAVMTMGANIQWGYAGLINFGIMGYTALGGLAAVLISVDPVEEAWRVGGFDILMCFWFIVVMILVVRFILKNYAKSKRILSEDFDVIVTQVNKNLFSCSNYNIGNYNYKSYSRTRN